MNFVLNQIFDNTYPPEAAQFCNQNGYVIKEIEKQGTVRRFQIQEVPAPTQTDLNRQELAELESWMTANDYKQFKYLRGEYTDEEWAEIKAEFHTKASRISELRELLNEGEQQ